MFKNKVLHIKIIFKNIENKSRTFYFLEQFFSRNIINQFLKIIFFNHCENSQEYFKNK